MSKTPVALTIAGSDSGGGAGIQADLKAFARCGVHGTCAITAITAQSTVGVRALQLLDPELVLEQARAVIEDLGVDAVKVGMLGSADTARAVAGLLAELPPGTPVVVDPVMVAESGASLLEPDASEVLAREVLPRASVLTPNLPEARVLVGRARRANSMTVLEPEREGEALELARDLLELGPGAVVLTGGHREHAVDLLVERRSTDQAGDLEVLEIAGERHPDGAAHGSGCTHSSALAAELALGRTTAQAARRARELAGFAVAHGLRELGSGPGPVDVFDLAARRVP